MQQPEIGRNIKEARLNLGLTQIQLADKCRLDIRTIQRIETGKVNPRFYTLNYWGSCVWRRNLQYHP